MFSWASHTQNFFNHLHTVGEEHILWPVGGASIPSTCRWEGTELTRQSKAAKNENLGAESHRVCSLRSGKDPLTLDPHLPKDTGALNTQKRMISFMPSWPNEPYQRQASGSSRTTCEGHPQVFPGAWEAGVSKGQGISQDWAVFLAMTSAGHFPQSRRGQALWNNIKCYCL